MLVRRLNNEEQVGATLNDRNDVVIKAALLLNLYYRDLGVCKMNFNAIEIVGEEDSTTVEFNSKEDVLAFAEDFLRANGLKYTRKGYLTVVEKA